MNKDLNRARAILADRGCTCVLCQGDTVYESRERGIRPLLLLLDEGRELNRFSAADKVVGKATAFIYCLLDVKAVYSPVMSQAALQVLRDHGICAQYDALVPAILNRRADGFCPMETATKQILDPQQALIAIRTTLEALR